MIKVVPHSTHTRSWLVSCEQRFGELEFIQTCLQSA